MVSPSASSSASPAPEPSTSRPNYPGVTSPAIQAHIHDLAASALPPPRKQNQACDACRTRKVKCQQLPGQDKCQHCAAKNYPCTHFVQQATSEKKRSMAASRRPRTNPSAPPHDSSSLTSPHSMHPTLSLAQAGPLTNLYHSQHHLSTAHQNPTAHLIAYLFSPDETALLPGSIGSPIGAGYRSYFRSPPPPSSTAPTSPEWADLHRKLADEPARFEFALDLVEVYFQICHMRMPLLDPDQIRSRLRHSLNPLATTPSGSTSTSSSALRPLPPALLATLIAWGAKFSEHPILVQDRKTSPGGRSRIARLLLHRAREVAEGEKVHRVPTPENVVISMLMDPLQSQSLTDPDAGFKGFWINCGIRHLFDLQINHRSTADSMVREERDMMTFAWWMSCLTDAFGSAFFRRKPAIDDDDYNFEMDTNNIVPVAPLSSSSSKSSPATTQAEFVTMWTALHDMARLARTMSKLLWRPVTAEEGIPFETLRSICASLTQWRDKHLSRVGVPTNFEAEWDFVAAVSACSSDAQYHVMWIIMFNALDEFGLKESNDMARAQDQGTTPPVTMTRQEAEAVDGIKTQVMDEALHGALRIAALAGVLTTNGYLRLDPNVLHYSIYAAGILLARLGRPEVSNCISGLQQYGFAYEEALDQAAEMNQVYQAAAPQAHSGVDHASGGGGGFQPPPPPPSAAAPPQPPLPTQQQQQQSNAAHSPHPQHVTSPPAAAGYNGALPESADVC